MSPRLHLAVLAAALVASMLLHAGRAARDEALTGELAPEEDATPQPSLCNDGEVCCSGKEGGHGGQKCMNSCSWGLGRLLSEAYPYEATRQCKLADLVWYVENEQNVHGHLLQRFVSAQNADFSRAGEKLVEMEVGTAGTVFVVGDLHGALDELLYTMRRIKDVLGAGPAVGGSSLLVCKPGVHYVFLGDYVDRGEKDVETVTLALAYRTLCPLTASHGVLLLRGNHEDIKLNTREGYDFAKRLEGVSKNSLDLFDKAWQTLPVAATINRKVLLVHGGLAPWLVESHGYDGFKSNIATSDFESRKELLWNDPVGAGDGKARDWLKSTRGKAFRKFGKGAMDAFSSRTGIQLVVRGHEVQPRGHSISFEGSLLSLHTKANVVRGSYGAFARIDGAALDRAKLLEEPKPAAVISAIQPTLYPHRIVGGGKIEALNATFAAVLALLQLSQSSMSALTPAGWQDALNATLEEDCEHVTAGARAALLQQAAESFRALLADGDPGSLAMRTEILIDQLGEAGGLTEDAALREGESCGALLQAQALKALLENHEAVQSGDENALNGEVDMKRAWAKQARSELQSRGH